MQFENVSALSVRLGLFHSLGLKEGKCLCVVPFFSMLPEVGVPRSERTHTHKHTWIIYPSISINGCNYSMVLHKCFIMNNSFIYIWLKIMYMTCWMTVDGHPHTKIQYFSALSQASLSTFGLSLHFALLGMKLSHPSTACVQSTVNSGFPRLSRSPSSCFFSFQCPPMTLWSAALFPWCFLYHSGLSYIMHVKQTDMSESLKGMAVPSLQL